MAVQKIATDKNKMFITSAGGSVDLSGKFCTPNFIQWTYNTFALANVAGKEMVRRGGNSWFFIVADYTFGRALEKDVTDVVTGAGGKIVGRAPHPINTTDFSSNLLKAKESGAKVIALANSGGDMQTAIILEFEIERMFAGLRVGQEFSYPLYIPVIRFGFIARMFDLFFGDDARLPHFFRPAQVRVEHLGFRLPVVQVRGGAAGAGAGGFQVRCYLAVIELRQNLTFLHLGAGLGEDCGDRALPLGAHVDLIFDDEGTGSDEHRLGGRCRGRRGRIRRSVGGRNHGASVFAPEPQTHDYRYCYYDNRLYQLHG